MLSFLIACAATPAAESVHLSDPVWSAHTEHITASVLPWSRGGEDGRLVLARVSPQATTSVLTTNTPTPLQELLPVGDMVAINGGFYDGAGVAMGLSISDGRLITPLRKGGGSGVLLLSADGPRISHRDDVGDLDGVTGAVQSIDRLASEGRILVSEQASLARDARSAVAVTADGGLLFAVLFAEAAVTREEGADIYLDAGSSSSGVSLREWSALLVGLGGVAVLNLDGGYSTSIHIDLDGARLDVHPHGATINAVVAR
ncbi:MAG: hypothetical protein ACI8RZ_000301 [Myxococcota bacterium]|jgi:hypothetical protein